MPGGMDDFLNLYPPSDRTEKEKRRGEYKRKPQSPGRKTLEKMEPQVTLDVHGFRGEEAKREVLAFIKNCRRKGIKKAFIIHGKGLHSQEGAVLRPMIRKLLDSHPQVKNWGKAPLRDGGEGATWFVL
jgi:DNA-nicking Smr family endonuclease